MGCMDGQTDGRTDGRTDRRTGRTGIILNALLLPYLPYIFGRIKIIIFFTVRTFNFEKNYKFFSVRIFMNAEKLPIIRGVKFFFCSLAQ